MTPKISMVTLLCLVSVSALVPERAFSQTSEGYQETISLLGKGACEVFGRRGLIDNATRQACCQSHNVACPEGTQGGFGGGTSQSQGFGGGGTQGPGAGNSTSQAQSAADAIGALGGGRSSGSETSAPQGSNVGRNANSRGETPDAVKKNPFFYEDWEKYPQGKYQ